MPLLPPWVLAFGFVLAGQAEPGSPPGTLVGPPPGTDVPRFRHDKEPGCAALAHQRVRALLDGVPWPPPDPRPVASNRPCR